tara:strand:+ start:282 stop:476 length:195 start_codon:yes stop_codon:yes gene_type:complete
MEHYIFLARGQFGHDENPTEEQINAKAQELKDEDTQREADKATGKQKLKDLGLSDAELKAIMGI